MALGESRMNTLGATVGRLGRLEQGLFKALGGLVVQVLVSLAQQGQGRGDLVGGGTQGVQDLLSALGGGVGHEDPP